MVPCLYVCSLLTKQSFHQTSDHPPKKRRTATTLEWSYQEHSTFSFTRTGKFAASGVQWSCASIFHNQSHNPIFPPIGCVLRIDWNGRSHRRYVRTKSKHCTYFYCAASAAAATDKALTLFSLSIRRSRTNQSNNRSKLVKSSSDKATMVTFFTSYQSMYRLCVCVCF